MPSAFVPFLKSGGKATASNGGSPTGADTDIAAESSAFAAMVPNNSPISAPVCAHAPNLTDGKPIVTLKKNGDQVTHIHIQCACGQVVELECAY